MLVFPSLSYEIWKPGLPFWWNPSPSTKLILPCHKSPRISRFPNFRGKKGKHHFPAKKEEKTQKTQNFGFFDENWPIWAFFLQIRSSVLPRFLPGSCPVLARFLPGSPRFCPVLPGSAWFSSSFLGDVSIFGVFFSSVFGWDQRKLTKNSEIFDRKEKICKTQKFSLGMRRIAKFGKLHEFLWPGSTKSRKFMSLAAVGNACEVWRRYAPRAHGALRATT